MSEQTALQTAPASFSLAPRDIKEAIEFAEVMSKSNLVPKDFIGNAGNIMVAVQWGMELGLQPMQAMQNIAVINGRPALWGDAVIALVKSSPACEYVTEDITDEIATCRVKRRGQPEEVRVFTKADAKTAGLLGKAGPWTQYPKRMMQMRARSWALRDVFPDVLRGMPVAEDVMDFEKEINPLPPKRQTGAQAAEAAKQASAADPATDAERNDREQLIADLEAIASGNGLDAYAEAWKSLSAASRKLIGADEHERLKRVAGAINAETGEIMDGASHE